MSKGNHIEADRRQLAAFVEAMFVHAEVGFLVALRAFRDDVDNASAFTLQYVEISNSLNSVVDAACDIATRAAQAPHAVVFCPPIATFSSKHATQKALAQGLALTVECDGKAVAALAALRGIIGHPTLVVASGGQYMNPDTGVLEDKLHLHWRLSEPTTTAAEHEQLRRARALACQIVGADATAISIVHPLRWPGSWHRKGEPRLCRIVEQHDTEIDLTEALDELEGIAAIRTAMRGGRAQDASDRNQLSPADLMGCAERMPNDAETPWNEWNRIGMAFWRASDGSDAGFDAFDRWSRTSIKYHSQTTRARWEHYRSSPPSLIGAGTLVFLARSADPSFRPGVPRDGGIGLGTNQPTTTVPNESDDAVALPRINVSHEDLRALTAAAMKALLATNKPAVVFRVGDLLSRVENDDSGAPVIRVLTKDRMRHRLARVAAWYKLKRHCGATVEVSALPHETVVADILACPNPPFPILRRVVEAPLIGPDGSVQDLPGYNPASQTYYAPAKGFQLRPVPENPTSQDVQRARDLLLVELLCDFPFVADADRAHAVALLLLPFVRELIDGSTPLHLIEKPAPGTGASLLSDVLLAPAIGRSPATLTEAHDEDEWRKRLTAKLATGPSVIIVDNVRGTIDSAALSSAITTPAWEDRILGITGMCRLSVRCACVATGNNPSVSNEIARRTIRIRIDAKADRPWLRNCATFRHPDLREWATANRSQLVWAALTLARAWVVAGKPMRREASLGMFEEWSRVIGGILGHAGILGFLGNIDEFYDQADAEGTAWRSLVAAWWKRYRDAEIGVSQLWKLIHRDETATIDLPLGAGDERSQRIRFGFLLKKQRDRQFDGLRIAQGRILRRAQLWHLVKLS